MKKKRKHFLKHSNLISYAIPNTIHGGEGVANIKFRVKSKVVKSNFLVKDTSGNVLAKKFTLACLPGEMQSIDVDRKLIKSDIMLEVESL